MAPTRLLQEYQALIAAAGDHLDHLPVKVRLSPLARTLADTLDHARRVAYEAEEDMADDHDETRRGAA